MKLIIVEGKYIVRGEMKSIHTCAPDRVARVTLLIMT